MSRRTPSTLLARHPWLSALTLVLVSAALYHLSGSVEAHYEVEDFFPEDTPERRSFDRYQESFGRDDRAAMMLLTSKTPFGLEDMRQIAALADRLEAREDIEAIIAPNRALIAVRSDNGIVELERALPDAALAAGDEARLALATTRFGQRPYLNQVLSEDGRVAIVTAIVKPGFLDTESRRALTRALEEEQATLAQTQGWDIQLAGYPIHRVYLTEHISRESKRLLPLVLVIIALVLLVIFRRLTGVLLPVMVAAISVVWCLGLMSLFDIPTNILAPALIILVALVSVTDAIHFTSTWRDLVRRGTPRREVPRRVLEALLLPCMLTSLTTAVVFAGLSLTGIPLIAEFGLGVAVGVVAAFVVTVLLAPPVFALLGLLPRFEKSDKKPREGRLNAVLDRLDAFVARHPRRVLAASAALFVIFGAGVPLVELNSPLLADLEPSHPVQQTNRFIEAKLGGVIPLDLVLYAPQGQPPAQAYRAERMHRIEALTEALRAQPEVLDATSPVDILRQMQPLLVRVPQEEAVSLVPAALLLAYDQISPWVDERTHTMRIRMRVSNLDTDEALALFERIEALHAEHLSEPTSQVSLTGQGYLGQIINKQLVEHFQSSFLVGLLLVLLMIGLAFFSPRLPFVALLPNLFPLVVVAGVMGFVGIELRYTSALVLSVVFGLAVDDTIHTLAQLHAHRAEPDPIRAATRSAGVGIVWTSAVLAAGFITLTSSDFIPNQVLGLLLSLTAVAALWGDLVLLPAILRVFSSRRARDGRAPRLEPVTVPISQLSEGTIDSLYALFEGVYDGTERARFREDLMRKQHIILLRIHGVGPIRGFSTLRVMDVEDEGRLFRVLFSGDTVIAPEFWGQKALQTGFTLFMFRLRLRTLNHPVFWLLTTKGYKTYLLMTNYFARSWPRHDLATPPLVEALRRKLGAVLFGDAFEPDKGVAPLRMSRDRIKTGLCDIRSKDLENPHIRHFAKLNPDHAKGDELVCLAQIRFRDPFLIYVGVLRRRLGL